MKKLITSAICLIGMICTAQLKFNNKEFVSLSVVSNSEGLWNPNKTATSFELQYDAPRVYVRAVVKKGFEYFDWSGVIGTAIQNNKIRLYTGVKIGTVIINRNHYALTGLESGIDFLNCSRWSIGPRVSFDYVAGHKNRFETGLKFTYKVN